MMFGGTLRCASATVIGALSFTPMVGLAQDNPGLNAALSFSQGLTLSEADGLTARSDLGFDLTSVTRTQNFAFSIGGAAELSEGEQLSLEDPRLSLSYQLESRASLLSTSLSFARQDADAITEVATATVPILVLDEGTRQDRTFTFGYTFGREELFGGNISFTQTDTSYFDTSSTEFVDSITQRLTAGLSFEIDPRITATMNYAISETDRDTGRDVRTERLSLGADLAITQSLTANIGLGLTQNTTDDAGVRTVSDGLNYNLSFTQARPNGDIGGRFNSDVTETGRRSSLVLSRAFELPRGSFSGSVGVTKGSDTDILPTYQLAYTENLPRGSYNVAFDQSFGTTTDGNEVLNSNLRANWQQDLTRNAKFSTNISYRLKDFSGGGNDENRFDFGINYSQNLNEDWSFVTSYNHSFTEVDSGASDREHTLFLGLETSIGWRP